MANVLQINYWTVGGFEGNKDPEKALREAKAIGYDGLELTFGAGHLAPGVAKARCLRIRNVAAALGMRIETMASGNFWGQSFGSPSAAVRAKAVAFTKEYLQVANWLGAKTVLVIPGAVAVPWDPSKPVVPYADVWKNATACIRKLLPVAARLKVAIGLENVWNWFLADPVAMRTFIDQFRSPWVGSYFDIANVLINGYPEHWISILGRRIKAVHFKNFAREDCGGKLHGFGDDLLKGAADWKAVMSGLRKIDYKGPITAEMIPFSRLPKLVLPDMKLARDTARKLRRIARGR